MHSSDCQFSRVGAIAAIAGLLIYGGSAVLHPGTAPHETEAAFSHYAQESNWALIHLGELLGILLMSTASIALAWRLRRGSIVWPTLAGAAIAVFAAVYAVFIAVDGVALGIMVERWVQAPPERQELLYETAFAVRQIEAGLFGIQWLIFGFATGLFSAAFFAGSATPFSLTWMTAMGWLSALASLGALLFGVAQAQLGFSETSMAFQAGLFIAGAWTLAVGLFLFRHPVHVGGVDGVHVQAPR